MTAIRASVKRAVRAVPLPWLPWLPAAAVLLGTGWGSNQFTPMLLVYRQALGLGTGTLEAMFGFYALGLIPGLLVAGPLSDAHGRRRVAVPAAAFTPMRNSSIVSVDRRGSFATMIRTSVSADPGLTIKLSRVG